MLQKTKKLPAKIMQAVVNIFIGSFLLNVVQIHKVI